MNIQAFAHGLLWCIPLINLVGLFGQVRKNWHLRSTAGMNNWSLWTSHVAMMSFAMYCHLLHLPLSLRVLVPIEATVLTFLVVQAVWYEQSIERRHATLRWHSAVVLGAGCLWCVSAYAPLAVGQVLGWLGVVMVALAQLPQIIQHWRTKSVAGYSKIMLASATISATLLIWISLVLSLPLPSLANSIRALIKRLILWWQVFLYHER